MTRDHAQHAVSPPTRAIPQGYRADRDQQGRWFVWRRVADDGWVAWKPYQNAAEAYRAAAECNRTAHLA